MAFIPYISDSGQFPGTITVADSGTSTATGSNASSIYTGTPTANSFVSINALNYNSFSLQVSGTWVGTLQVENSYDNGTTWYRVVPQVRGVSNSALTITANGGFISEAAVATNVRIRATAWTSGTAVIAFMQSPSSEIVRVDNPIRLYDNNSSQQATIKPASTAPVATDTGLVTAESPNSPLFTSTIRTKLANDIAPTTGTITTSTSTITTGQLSGVGSATVQFSGTFAGVNATFEGSVDNTSWVAIPALPLATATPTVTTTTGVIATTSLYNLSPLLGLQYVRVRATAFTSGTANVTIQPSAQFYGYNVNAIVTSAPTTAVSQSGTWTVQPGNTANTTPWLVAEQKSATAAITSVTAAVASTTVLAANANRKGMMLYNDSTAILYLAFAATASTTSYTLQVAAGGYYEMPIKPVYTGLLTGIWSAANGSVRVTELS